MRTVLKWVGVAVLALVALVVLGALGLYVRGGQALRATFDPPAESLTLPTGPEAQARGQYLLSTTTGCMGCHGGDLGGTPFIDDGMIGTLWAPNLTSGQGGVGAFYTDADWERAIRHGVRPNGQGLIIMPSHQYNRMSDEDLGAVLAYLKTFAPVDRATPARQLAPLGQILMGAGMLPPPAPRLIDHSAVHPATVERALTPEYGAYVLTLGTCVDCHGPNLDGQAGGGAPSEVPPSDLTPSGNLGQWSEADFIQAMRTGVTPDGRALSEEMPWRFFGNMDDQDLAALFAYLKTVPPSGQ